MQEEEIELLMDNIPNLELEQIKRLVKNFSHDSFWFSEVIDHQVKKGVDPSSIIDLLLEDDKLFCHYVRDYFDLRMLHINHLELFPRIIRHIITHPENYKRIFGEDVIIQDGGLRTSPLILTAVEDLKDDGIELFHFATLDKETVASVFVDYYSLCKFLGHFSKENAAKLLSNLCVNPTIIKNCFEIRLQVSSIIYCYGEHLNDKILSILLAFKDNFNKEAVVKGIEKNSEQEIARSVVLFSKGIRTNAGENINMEPILVGAISSYLGNQFVHTKEKCEEIALQVQRNRVVPH